MNNQLSKLLIQNFRMMSKKDQNRFLLLFAVAVVNGLIQTLGVVSIMPFISILADPSLIQQHPWFNALQEYFSINSYQEWLLITGSVSLVALFISNAFIVMSFALSLYFSNTRGADLSESLLKQFLAKPFLSFHRYSTSELSKMIFSDVDRALVGSQMACLSIVSDVMIFLCISALLVYINPHATIVTVTSLGLSFLVIYGLLSKRIEKMGKEYERLEKDVFSQLKQALSLYKEIKVFNKSAHFVDNFARPLKTMFRNASSYYVMQFVPIQIIELMVFSIILVLAGYLTLDADQTGTASALASLSLYAFAAYRLIPIFKSMFESIEELIYITPTLELVIGELSTKNAQTENIKTIEFTQLIELRDLVFQYPGNPEPTLNGVNACFHYGELTCIAGPSGLGKSTFLDVLLGLLPASSGSILIDGVELNDSNINSWRQQIGYVGQRTQLLDASIIDNIAFGEQPQKINRHRVIEVAKLACIHEKIESLSNGYNSAIGEGNLKLSGGEQQRIAIARALYHKPKCLILDEATNELDINTEGTILNHLLAAKLTMIFVSHKPSVMNLAHRVVRVQDTSWRQTQ